MRLYVNTKEVPYLKDALREQIQGATTLIERSRLSSLLERVILCEKLQKSERRAKKEEHADPEAFTSEVLCASTQNKKKTNLEEITMTKYTNPFYTLNEAISVLKSLGADPYKIGATNAHPWDSAVPTQDEAVFWNDHVLGVSTSRVYAGFSHYNVVEIHLTAKGFDALVDIIDAPVHKKPFGDETEFDMYWIEPATLLKIFALYPCESDSVSDSVSGDQK